MCVTKVCPVGDHIESLSRILVGQRSKCQIYHKDILTIAVDVLVEVPGAAIFTDLFCVQSLKTCGFVLSDNFHESFVVITMCNVIIQNIVFCNFTVNKCSMITRLSLHIYIINV